MSLAIEEAKKGEATAFPNPMVGCVLVDSKNRLISKGYHERPGGPHAERMTLTDVDVVSDGAVLYVTLEPCCSWGRTPPCTDIIFEKNIRHVVIGMLDPDPRMRGASVAVLEERGIKVQVGVLEEECRQLNRRYLSIREQNRPTIALKAAITVDGKIVGYHGDSKWITSSKTRMHAHQLRSIYDGILVGSQTVLHDDPKLNCRIEGGRNPTPILLDTNAKCPQEAQVLHVGKRPLHCVGPHAPLRDELPVDRIVCSLAADGRIDIPPLLELLYEKGMYTVLVEGGAAIIQSFIRSGCVDVLELYVGAKFLGGGRSFGEGCNFTLPEAPHLILRSVSSLDSDVHLSYYWGD